MKKLLLGTIACFGFVGPVEAQGVFHPPISGNEVFAAYCIGVFQVHIAHQILWFEHEMKDNMPTGAAKPANTTFLENRIKQLREYLLKQTFNRYPNGGYSSGEHDTLEQSVASGLDDAGECYKTSHERASTCSQEAYKVPMDELCKQVAFTPEWWECAKKLGSFNQDAYDSCQRRLEPESCRRHAKCGDLSRLSIK
jgi:hypothetical protein